MFAKLKAIFGRLAGPRDGEAADGLPAVTVEYKGYRIKPAPYRTNGQFQTAGFIEKDTAEGLKEHRFVRADTHATREDAIEFAISKAKQIIDSQADGIFR